MRRHSISYLLSLGALASAQNIFTVAGIPYSHRDDVDSHPALNAPLGSVYGLLLDKTTGRLIFNDEILVLRMESDGTLLALLGSGTGGYLGVSPPPPSDSLPGNPLASALSVSVLRGMAQDSSGALYLSDAGAGRVYRLAVDGTVTTFAGGGTLPFGFQTDGGPATAANLPSPRGLVFDSKGNLDIAEVFCSCIRRVTPEGIISTVYALPTGQGRVFANIEGLTIDAQDNLYFTEWFGHQVWRVASDGTGATVIAGTGTPGFSGDGGPAISAQLDGPSGVTLDSSGNIYIADTTNNRIRKITTDGIIHTIAGSGAEGTAIFGGSVDKCGFSGDGGPAPSAQLCKPAEVMFDASGNLLIADYGNNRVRGIAPNGTIATVAGSGHTDPALSFPPPNSDGGPEIRAGFGSVSGAAFDAAGNLYVSDAFGNNIRKIAVDGAVSTYAGTGQLAYGGDGGPAIQAQLARPGPIAFGPDGALYVITDACRVRKITPDGIIHLVAGNGTPTSIATAAQGDGGLAVNATLNEPGGVAFDQHGNIFIADTSNARVRKVNPNGIITTVAGPAQPGVDYYNAVAVDPRGNLYVAWTHAPPPNIDATVNLVNPDGSLTPVAGSGQPCTSSRAFVDGAAALQVQLCAVVAMSVDPSGLLNLSEGEYSLVLRLNADGTLQRVAGNSTAKYVGDGGPVLQASLTGSGGFSPGALAFDPSGKMYIPQPLNLIRQVTNSAYNLALSPDRISLATATAQTVTIATSGNFAEPFPYTVLASTSDGSAWLSANRTTGLVGESIIASVNPAGLAPGTYHGTISVVVFVSGSSHGIEMPVTLTVP